jgi:hypothetical protein
MLRVLLTLVLVGAIAGCSGANTALHNVQFSGAAEPFPTDYAARALRYLGAQPTAGVSVSYPQTTVGETALSPKRWYICLTGLMPPGPPSSTAKPLLDAAFDLARRDSSQGIYEVILVLRASGTVSALKGFDSPLCADGRYEALAAV